jgi:hypothetical protein
MTDFIETIKRQWLRLKYSWQAFAREWKFNFRDRQDHIIQGKPFYIMGYGGLRNEPHDPDKDTFEMRPPYYGQPVGRINGHVFTLKYTHYNPETGVVRYSNKKEPENGFELVSLSWLYPGIKYISHNMETGEAMFRDTDDLEKGFRFIGFDLPEFNNPKGE